jgi:ferredoxin, 2Fe-2S
MAKITFITKSGSALVLDIPSGHTLRDAAVQADVPGIVGECGGACACATCHVYIDEAWTARVGPPSDAERSLLEFADAPAGATSRLTCQVMSSPELDGLVVHVASV